MLAIDTQPRRTLVLAGEARWARQLAATAWHPDGVWIGNDAPSDIPTLPPAKARQLLGQDLPLLVIDAHAGLDPDALGAASGAVMGGGHLLLLTPSPDQWPGFNDPNKARHASYPLAPEVVGGRFLRRLVDVLTGADGVQWLHPATAPAELSVARPDQPPTSTDLAPCLTVDQAQAVEALLKVARGHRRRPLVLTADRGRGKSAALGIAAARLLADGVSPVVVTAPRAAGANTVFEHALRLLRGAERHGNRLTYDGAELVFVAPDALAQHVTNAALVLVDEAAAIPVPLLTRLLDRHARIAFSTTVHGYEGNGRGFALRFRSALEGRTPQWRAMNLETPIRYPAGDPLERWVNQALLLAAEPAALQAPVSVSDSHVIRIDKAELATDETRLSQVFGLLVQAHYQTRPSDLRQLLDAPDVDVWIATSGDVVLGVALVVAEGGLDAAMAAQVARGARRPRGHLIPQSMAAHAGDATLATQRTARVMRIAVHEQARRQGLGRLLVKGIAQAAASAGFDWIGASFGADVENLRFWQQVDFALVRIGAGRDGASGSYSATLVRPLSSHARRHVPALHNRAVAAFAHGLGDLWRDMEPAVAAALLRRHTVGPAPDEQDRQEASDFAGGTRDRAACQLGLWHYVVWALGRGRQVNDQTLLVRCLLQRRPAAEVASEYGIAGAAQLDACLRSAMAALLAKPVA